MGWNRLDFVADAISYVIERLRPSAIAAVVLMLAGGVSFGFRFGWPGAMIGAGAGGLLGFFAGLWLEWRWRRASRIELEPPKTPVRLARRHVPEHAPIDVSTTSPLPREDLAVDPNAPIEERIALIEATADRDLEKAIVLARDLVCERPRDARPLRVEARLLRRAERDGEAVLVDEEASLIESLTKRR
jgi:hypothetical protein